MIRIDRQGWIRQGVLAFCALFLLFSLPLNREPARVIRVITGDTMTIQYNAKWEELKLLGIEAPETNMNDKIYEKALQNSTTPEKIIQQGKQSLSFLSQQVGYGSQIWLEFDVQKRDRFSRLLAYVYLPNGRMLNEIMLKEGYANIANYPPNLKYQDRFAAAFRQAKDNKKGFWKPEELLPKKK